MSCDVHSKLISSVGIIGCGWLGNALAMKLNSQAVNVLATRSTKANVEQLETQGIKGEILSLPEEQETLNKHVIFNQQCLVIAITPQFRSGRVDYADKVKQLVNAARVGGHVEKIILLSSTAIYNGLTGEVTETSVLDFSADKVSILNQAEQAVLNFNSVKDDNRETRAYILRLSGLVGPNRHPGKFLLNGRMLKSPNAIVNLIHQQDAVGLILSLLESDKQGGIFNGVSTTQVSKKEYYQTAAKALGATAPVFEENEPLAANGYKRVSGQKTKAEINYTFVYDDLLYWLEQGE